MKVILLNSIFMTLLFFVTNANGFDELGKEKVTSTDKSKILLSDIKLLMSSGECDGDLCSTMKKAVEDAIDEAKSSANLREDAGQIFEQYVEDVVNSGNTLADKDLRFRREKVIDALWLQATAPLIPTSENGAKVTLETYLNSILSEKTSAYGPNSAATFATWFAYMKTCDKGECDPELALRMGMLHGAASFSKAKTDGLSIEERNEPGFVKRIIVGGALDGLAIAIRGGDEHAIKREINKAAGSVVVRDGYRKVVYQGSDSKSSKIASFCINAEDLGYGCVPTNSDMKATEDKVRGGSLDVVDVVGKESFERAARQVRKNIDKMPAIQSMSILQGQWSFDVIREDLAGESELNSDTHTPLAFLTYVGRKAHAKTETPALNSSNNPGPMQSPQEAIEALKNNNQKKELPINGTVDASLVCLHGSKNIQILVESPSEEHGLACRVITKRERGEWDVPWSANYNEQYCKEKATALTVKKIGQGWSCYVH